MTPPTEAPEAREIAARGAASTSIAFRPNDGSMRPFYRGMRSLLRGALGTYFRVKSRGEEHEPSKGPFLILSNHYSYLDPIIVGMKFKREIHFLARSGVTQWPLIGPFCTTLLNTHPIKRASVDREAIKMCLAILGADWPLMMFPEGTRAPRGGDVAWPKGGFGMILDRMPELPCMPAYIEGSDRAFGRGVAIPRPAEVRVSYGEPFVIDPRGEGEKTPGILRPLRRRTRRPVAFAGGAGCAEAGARSLRGRYFFSFAVCIRARPHFGQIHLRFL